MKELLLVLAVLLLVIFTTWLDARWSDSRIPVLPPAQAEPCHPQQIAWEDMCLESQVMTWEECAKRSIELWCDLRVEL